ncbi:MAG: MarR family transcriptional regulator [Actinomycetota bacterium]|nr:MarR family transcriptional regulator [Actinomycetota bacterium]
MARDPDRVEALVAQWEAERPDLDLETMALAARLLGVGRMIDARIGALAAEHGMTVGEGDILLTLRRSGAPYRLLPTQLTGSLLVSSGTMTNRLDRLERRGLVERVPNPEDRRSVEIALTDEGRELVDAVIGEHVAREQEMLAPLSARERETLTRILRKLAAHVEAL